MPDENVNTENTGEQQTQTPPVVNPPVVAQPTTTTAQAPVITDKSDGKIDVDDIVRRAVTEAVQSDRDQRNENKAKAAGFASFKEMTDYAIERKKEVESQTPEVELLRSTNKTLKEENDQLNARILDLTLSTELVDFLSKKYPHYMGRQDWILPKLKAEVTSSDNTDVARRSAIERVVKSFVTDNPITASATDDTKGGKTTADSDQQPGSGAGPTRTTTGAPTPMRKLAESEGRSYVHNAMRSGLYPRIRQG